MVEADASKVAVMSLVLLVPSKEDAKDLNSTHQSLPSQVLPWARTVVLLRQASMEAEKTKEENFIVVVNFIVEMHTSLG